MVLTRTVALAVSFWTEGDGCARRIYHKHSKDNLMFWESQKTKQTNIISLHNINIKIFIATSYFTNGENVEDNLLYA